MLIVFESLFGNTREIANAVAEGVRQAEPAAEVSCTPVADATADVVRGADLLVVGGPTHLRGMTSGPSRWIGLRTERASGQGPRPEPGASGPGVREWLRGLPVTGPGHRAAAFDTHGPGRFAGGASTGIAARLRAHGYELVAEPEHFVVDDELGPPREGEVERARAWGAALVRAPAR